MTYIPWFSHCAYYSNMGYMSKMLWNNESVESSVRSQTNDRSLRYIFHGSVNLPYIFKNIGYMHDAFGYEPVRPIV